MRGASLRWCIHMHYQMCVRRVLPLRVSGAGTRLRVVRCHWCEWHREGRYHANQRSALVNHAITTLQLYMYFSKVAPRGRLDDVQEVADVASPTRRQGGGMSLLVHLLLPSALGGRWFPLDAPAPATLAAGRAMPLYPLPALYLPGSTCMVAAPAALPTPPAAPAAAAAPTAPPPHPPRLSRARRTHRTHHAAHTKQVRNVQLRNIAMCKENSEFAAALVSLDDAQHAQCSRVCSVLRVDASPKPWIEP